MSLLESIPHHLKSKYKIVYVQYCSDQFYSFKTHENFWGILSKDNSDNFKIIISPSFDSAHYDIKREIITAVKYPESKYIPGKNSYYLYNSDGKLISGFLKIDHIFFDKYGNNIIQKDKKFGLLNDNYEYVVDCKFTELKAISKNIFKAKILHLISDSGLYKNYDSLFNGIINIKNELLAKFSPRTEILDLIYLNTVIINEEERYFSFNLDSSEKTELLFQQILESEINFLNDSIPIYKSVVNLSNPYIYHYPFDAYDYHEPIEGKWGIISADGKIIIPNDYDYIEVISKDYFRVAKGEFIFTEDEEEWTITLNGMKWGIIDIHNKIVIPIKYDFVGINTKPQKAYVNLGGTLTKNEREHKPEWRIYGGEDSTIDL